jgi:hypothetical protein
MNPFLMVDTKCQWRRRGKTLNQHCGKHANKIRVSVARRNWIEGSAYPARCSFGRLFIVTPVLLLAIDVTVASGFYPGEWGQQAVDETDHLVEVMRSGSDESKPWGKLVPAMVAPGEYYQAHISRGQLVG